MNNNPELIERLHAYIYKDAQCTLENEYIELCKLKPKATNKQEMLNNFKTDFDFWFSFDRIWNINERDNNYLREKEFSARVKIRSLKLNELHETVKNFGYEQEFEIMITKRNEPH